MSFYPILNFYLFLSVADDVTHRMPAKPVLYSYWRSTAAWRVRIALNLKRVDFDYRSVDLLSNDDLSSDEFVSVNPAKKVPVYVDRCGNAISESLAIIEYLDEMYPNINPLLPRCPVKRAQSRSFALQVCANILPLQTMPVVVKLNQKVAGYGDQFAAGTMATGLREMERIVRSTRGKYCIGDEISVADLVLPGVIYNALCRLNRFGTNLDCVPNLMEINNRLAEIPAFNYARPERQPDAPFKLGMPKPILYSYWRSSCSWRVRIALNLKGEDYEYRTVNLLSQESVNGAEFVAANPAKKVPVYIDEDGNAIGESLAIIEYLDEKFPDKHPLLPRNLVKRAQARAIALQVAAGIQPLQNVRVLKTLNEKEAGLGSQFCGNAIAVGLQALEDMVKKTHGKYCVGDEVTIADLVIPSQMYNAKRFKVDLTQFPTLLDIDAALAEIDEFKAAAPDMQPDANLNA